MTPDGLAWHSRRADGTNTQRGLSCSLQPCTVICSGRAEILDWISVQYHIAGCAHPSACTPCRPPASPPGSEFIRATSRLSQTLLHVLDMSFDIQARGFVSNYMVLLEHLGKTGVPSACAYLWHLNGEKLSIHKSSNWKSFYERNQIIVSPTTSYLPASLSCPGCAKCRQSFQQSPGSRQRVQVLSFAASSAKINRQSLPSAANGFYNSLSLVSEWVWLFFFSLWSELTSKQHISQLRLGPCSTISVVTDSCFHGHQI